MEVHNRSGLAVGWCVSQVQGPTATLIAKGTFRLRPGAPAVPAEEQPLPGGDLVDDTGLLRYPSDFAWKKPKTDLLLVGTCHVPGGRPDTVCRVTFLVGKWWKQIAVIGERTRRRRFFIFDSVTEPLPFEKQRLSYEFSFGGPKYPKNPHGRGFGEGPMPRVEDPGRLVVDSESRPEPAGFGPMPLLWPQRYRGLGTYDREWLEKLWPGFPADFDWSVFNSAPRDQRPEAFLRGDEKLAFENLHPEHAIYTSGLPKLRVRWLVNDREVEMNLDTLWVDMDEEKLVLVWRGVTPIAHRKMRDIRSHVIVAEPVVAPKEEIVAPVESARAETAPDPAREKHLQLLAVWEEVRRKEPEIAKKLGPPPEPAPEAALQGQDLRGADLRGKDMTGADLTNADLTGAQLEGAKLDQAELSGAKLTGCRVTALRGARLYGANLDGADLSGACLAGADLGTASLAKANLKGADLSGASLVRIQAAASIWEGANLTGATFEGADVTAGKFASVVAPRTVWDDAKLDGADFTKATLPRASFASATLAKSTFPLADLKETRFFEANLAGADLSQVNLFRADLEGADLSNAQVVKSNLHGAEVWRAKTPGTNFGQSILTGTKLE